MWMSESHLKSEDFSPLAAPRGWEVPNYPRVRHHQDPAVSQSQTPGKDNFGHKEEDNLSTCRLPLPLSPLLWKYLKFKRIKPGMETG